MADILHRIYEAKRRASERDEARDPYESVRERALESRAHRRPFLEALRGASAPAIVAEIKRASPSAGLIARNCDPSQIALRYDAAGVDAISVLTESDHFLGELAFLRIARERSSRPILRKDFLRTRYEIAQSAAFGADAVLLILAGLNDAQARACRQEAALYDLDTLVEVHDAAELDRAVALEADLIGINNRNLRTFETDLAVSEYLLPHVPAGMTAISESGMETAQDARRLHAAGARGFLIGEAMMRADDPAELVRAFKSVLAVR